MIFFHSFTKILPRFTTTVAHVITLSEAGIFQLNFLRQRDPQQ